MASNSKFKILTPHAAVIVWNYNDRISGDVGDIKDEQGINTVIISTVSCLSIQTNKSKSSPAGTFQLVLAPSKNWVSTITAGSWCAILMSNKPITAKSIQKADPYQVKMFGKIESVRADVVNNDGVRQTRFLVSGTDWGHIFNNILYIDSYIASEGEQPSISNTLAIKVRNMLLGENGLANNYSVKENLNALVNIFGNDLENLEEFSKEVGRLGKSTYDFILPPEVLGFFQFIKSSSKKSTTSNVISKLLQIQTGKLIDQNTYDEIQESFGYINPLSLQGTNTFWQILLDNSNPALNEMYNEIDWTNNGPQLTLYNRIKPFSYKEDSVNSLRSLFKFIKIHNIDPVTVLTINAGTNWRDKYNFIEIKPQFQEFAILGPWVKTKSQISDTKAFNREGFRPYMVGTKQFPVAPDGSTTRPTFNADQLIPWKQLIAEWYFDTHRLLNGTMTIAGQNEYIAVGNNIKFDAGLINPTPNINQETNDLKKNKFILAHIESVSHLFSIKDGGEREYITTIQFVRGIIVDQSNKLVGEGVIDQFAEDMSQDSEKNTVNTIVTSEKDDPDRNKVRGKK